MNVLFVCTGNICRSPMAEGFARSLAEVHHFASAGTRTDNGYPASRNGVIVMDEVGIDISDHRSRTLESALGLVEPDVIYAMAGDHVAEIRGRFPNLAERVQMLRPDGISVEDPYGMDLDAYRATRAEIAAAITSRSEEWPRTS